MRMIGSMPTLRFSWNPGLALLDLVVVFYLASPADFFLVWLLQTELFLVGIL